MTGRPTDYSEENASELCALIAQGLSLRKACEQTNRSLSVVWSWLTKHEGFQSQYARAKEESGDSDQDRLDEIAEKVLTGELDPQAARVAADIIKWSASKKKPKKYGDKLDIGNANDTPFQITIAK
jgi:transposase